MTYLPNSVQLCDLKKGEIVVNDLSAFAATEHGKLQIQAIDVEGSTHTEPCIFESDRFSFQIPEGIGPICKISILAEQNAEVFAAENLFPATDEEFESTFKSHRDRSGDARTDHFIASQIFNNFTGEEGYRISAAVVASYKAIELLEDDLLSEAENMLLRSLTALPAVKLARSTRNNREHLQISVLCSLYHVYLARGNAEEFFKTLQTIYTLVEEMKFGSFYNLAYNSALSLRLLTLLQLIAGQQKQARRTSEVAFAGFKRASHDADNNLAHFKELRYVHDNTYEAMRIARRMKEADRNFVEKTLSSCLRISAKKFPEAFSTMMDTYLKSSELLRMPS